MSKRFCPGCQTEVEDKSGFCLLGHRLALDPPIASLDELRAEAEEYFHEEPVIDDGLEAVAQEPEFTPIEELEPEPEFEPHAEQETDLELAPTAEILQPPELVYEALAPEPELVPVPAVELEPQFVPLAEALVERPRPRSFAPAPPEPPSMSPAIPAVRSRAAAPAAPRRVPPPPPPPPPPAVTPAGPTRKLYAGLDEPVEVKGDPISSFAPAPRMDWGPDKGLKRLRRRKRAARPNPEPQSVK